MVSTPDGTYMPKIRRANGGDDLVFAVGAKLDLSASTTHGLVTLPVDLTNCREIFSNATTNIAGNGGILASDTTPVLQRVNGATDVALRLNWAASNVDEIQLPTFVYPRDLDDASPVTIRIWAAMAATNDTPTLTVKYFEGVGDTDAGSATAAVTGATPAVYTATIAAADIGAFPKFANIAIVPSAHGTDALYIYSISIEYTRLVTLA